MWHKLWRAVKHVFASISIERLLAKSFSAALKEASTNEDYDRINKTTERCIESSRILKTIVDMKQNADGAVDMIEADLTELRNRLIDIWAAGGVDFLVERRIKELEDIV